MFNYYGLSYTEKEKLKKDFFEKIKTEMEKSDLSSENKKILQNFVEKFEAYGFELKEIFNYIDENKDYFSVSELFPENIFPALDILMGKERRELFLKSLENFTKISYGYSRTRKFITSKNYKNYFPKIKVFFENLCFLNFAGVSTLEGLKGEKVKFEKGENGVTGYVLTAEINAGNTEVIEFLKEMILSEKNTFVLNKPVFKGIFASENEELVELVGKLLLAAKLQEGLRQAICESMDEGTYKNFCYMFLLSEKENLFRFSSVKRALWTWVGAGDFNGDDRLTKKLVSNIKEIILEENEDKFLQSDDNIEVLLGIWKKGILGEEFLKKAVYDILAEDKKHKVLLASYFLDYVENKETKREIAKNIFKKYGKSKELSKDDLEIFACYKDKILNLGFRNLVNDEKRFEKEEVREVKSLFENEDEAKEMIEIYENIINSMNKSEIRFEPCIFPWNSASLGKEGIASELIIFADLFASKEEKARIVEKYLDFTSSYYRGGFLKKFLKNPENENEEKILIKALGKGGTTKEAFSIIKNFDFFEKYITEIEKNLALKTPEVRINSINTLFRLEESKLEKIVFSLLEAKSEQKVSAGLELALKIKNEGKNIFENISKKVSEMKTDSGNLQILIEQIVGETGKKEEKLDFYDENYAPIITYKAKRNFEPKEIFSVLSEKENDFEIAKKIVKKLDELIIKHENFEYKDVYGEERILGNSFYIIKLGNYENKEKEIFNFPLAEVWQDFYEKEINDYKVIFALDNLLNRNFFGRNSPDKQTIKKLCEFSEKIIGVNIGKIRSEYFEEDKNLKYFKTLSKIIKNLEEFYRDKKYVFEAGKSFGTYIYENFSKEEINFKGKQDYRGGEREMDYTIFTHPNFEHIYNGFSEYENKEDFEEYFSFKFKYDLFLNNRDVVLACIWGIVEKDYFYKRVLKNDKLFEYVSRFYYENLRKWERGDEFEEEITKFVKENLGVVIELILETELKRGEEKTRFSSFVRNIKEIRGIEYLLKILKSIGKLKLDRGSWSRGEDKKGILSHMLKVSLPNPEDSAESLKNFLKNTKITNERLVEVAMYSPAWIPIIEEYLGWKGLASGCYYFHAHISDIDREKEGIFAKYSPISIEDFSDGAFDIDWFFSAYNELGEKNFEILYESAKYVSDGAKHSRARKFADAVLGKIDLKDLTKNISEKRNQDSVKAYGLIPFKDEKKDILDRYLFLQKFLKESKQFGAQRRASEAKAVSISLENLSRRAGFSDVTRLICSVETDLIEDFQKYFEPKNLGDMEIFIKITDGKSEIFYKKDEKFLKSLPAKYKKDEYVLEIKEIHKNLKEQFSCSKKMFEKSMEDAVEFFGYEIKKLIEKNMIVSPILKNLVLKVGDFLGFYENGKIKDIFGKEIILKDEDSVKIAHCLDLLNSGKWADYQKYLFEKSIKQPFKQIFRELYVKREDELEKFHSLRYSGYQVGPARTVGALKTRSWVVDDYEGLQKVYYKENIIAKIYAEADWFSPAEAEAPSIDYVVFYNRKTGEELKISEVPDLIFSEVMRDVDLAVSVAFVGGVDPETSSSTIDMRKAIFSLNLQLFSLKNVEFSEKHAIISGELGEYSIHLGSGVIHKKSGSEISVLPVHSSHRGKIFLPFVDEDPKTAEIMTKILFFAEDTKIKDPSILKQIK